MKATSPPTDSVIEAEVDCLLSHVSPSNDSDERRRGLISYIQSLFDAHCHDYKLALGGSFPLQVYLPESDMDMTVLTPESDNDDLATVMQIFSCLCQAIKDNERQNDLPFAVDDAEFKIQSIEFVNARIRVVKCIINRMNLDITANQRNSLASATFLEEANRLIGQDSLFKKGLILVKLWCLNESSKYNSLNMSISGSKEGMLSSYALSILVLYLFNLVPAQVTTPLEVLRTFLETFASFPFDKYVVTLDGPVPIQSGGGSAPGFSQSEVKEKPKENRFRSIAERVHAALRSKDKASRSADLATFRLRTCNIVDPVDPVNNLGVSVSWKNCRCIKSTLAKAVQHLNDSLMYMESSLVQKTLPSPIMSDSGMITPPPNPAQLLANTPPPPPQRKPLVNMDALSGAVNNIAPGLIFPATSSNTPPIAASNSNSSPTRTPVMPVASSELELLPSSPTPGMPNANGNPPVLCIAPSISMSTSPAVTGIAAGSTGSRGHGHCNSATVPLLPTNTASLAKEFRFLKRFFPNCMTTYQLENAHSSTVNTGQLESAPGTGTGTVTYLSKLARSSSPYRDTSPVMPSSRGTGVTPFH